MRYLFEQETSGVKRVHCFEGEQSWIDAAAEEMRATIERNKGGKWTMRLMPREEWDTEVARA